MSRLDRPYRPPPRQSLRPHAQPYHAERLSSYAVGTAIMILLVLLVAWGAIYAYQRIFSALNTISSAQEVRVQPTEVGGGPPPPLLQRPFNLLVIGVDVRSDALAEGVRSDTLIVVHVDPLEQWASMLSIPRDTVVDIPNAACPTQKINAAYSCGYNMPSIYADVRDPRDSGAALAADTVEEYLGITIDHTLQVDFNGFQQLVDAMGGITVDVPRAILDPEYPTEDFGYMRLYYPAGLQRMNGIEALRYARTRHADNDFGRAQRQQQVVQAGIDELKRQNIVERIETVPKLLDALSDSVRTTMPINNIATLRGLGNLAQQMSPDRIKRLVLQPETNPDGSSTLLSDYNNLEWDPAYVQRMVREFTTPPEQSTAAHAVGPVVQVQNGTGHRGLAAQVTTRLEARGFHTVEAADSPVRDVARTVIIDYTGNRATAQQLGQLLNVATTDIVDQSDEPRPPNIDIVVRVGEDFSAFAETDTAVQR